MCSCKWKNKLLIDIDWHGILSSGTLLKDNKVVVQEVWSMEPGKKIEVYQIDLFQRRDSDKDNQLVTLQSLKKWQKMNNLINVSLKPTRTATILYSLIFQLFSFPIMRRTHFKMLVHVHQKPIYFKPEILITLEKLALCTPAKFYLHWPLHTRFAPTNVLR